MYIKVLIYWLLRRKCIIMALFTKAPSATMQAVNLVTGLVVVSAVSFAITAGGGTGLDVARVGAEKRQLQRDKDAADAAKSVHALVQTLVCAEADDSDCIAFLEV